MTTTTGVCPFTHIHLYNGPVINIQLCYDHLTRLPAHFSDGTAAYGHNVSGVNNLWISKANMITLKFQGSKSVMIVSFVTHSLTPYEPNLCMYECKNKAELNTTEADTSPGKDARLDHGL